jgi:hypothetical protein
LVGHLDQALEAERAAEQVLAEAIWTGIRSSASLT